MNKSSKSALALLARYSALYLSILCGKIPYGNYGKVVVFFLVLLLTLLSKKTKKVDTYRLFVIFIQWQLEVAVFVPRFGCE